MATAETVFLAYSIAKLEQLTGRIRTCLDQLTPEQIWWRASENSNSAGNLALHLAGNVRQWIGSGVGNLPNDRDRDAEFAARGGRSGGELAAHLEGTVAEAVEILRKVPPARLLEPLAIQGYEVTVLEGVYHVVEHFSQHTGQIVLLTKSFTGADLGFHRHIGQDRHGEHTP